MKQNRRSSSHVRYEVFFVRHGLSCSNFWLHYELPLIAHSKEYSDPELTKSGVLRSLQLGDSLKEVIKGKWDANEYAILSSPLIRAWETAYYMLVNDKESPKKINIVPYVTEIPTVTAENPSPAISLEDTPLSRQNQKRITDSINVGIEAAILSNVRRNADKKNSLANFKQFLSEYRSSLFKGISPTGSGTAADPHVYRAVVFTHSNLIHEFFGDHLFPRMAARGKERILNNEAVFVGWNEHGKTEDGEYDEDTFDYFDYGLTRDSVSFACPDECRASVGPSYADGSYCRSHPRDVEDDKRNLRRAQANLQRAYNAGLLVTKPFLQPLLTSGGGKRKSMKRNKSRRVFKPFPQ